MKKIFALMLAFVTLFSLFSCGDGGDGEGEAGSQHKFTSCVVKLVLDGEPIEGAKVVLKNASAGKTELLTTDDEGLAAKSYSGVVSGEWTAQITSIPSGYGIEKSEYQSKTYTLVNGTVTIEFNKEEQPKFVIKVVDLDGNAVVGAKVQLCNGDLCKPPRATDENGIVEFNYEDGDFTAKIYSVPDGYTYSTNEAEYTFDANHECTIEITKN